MRTPAATDHRFSLQLLSLVGVPFLAGAVAAQTPAPPAQARERLDQPPAPAGPARVVSVPRVDGPGWPRGLPPSRQVNVDESGVNITGDAANEPSIAVDALAPNRIAIGWRQFDTISSNFRQAGRAYSRDGGRTWTFPGPLTPGVFRSDPCLRADGHGHIYYLSLQSNFNTDVFASSDGGASFSGPFPAFGGDKEWLAIDRTGMASDGVQYEHYSTAFTRSFDMGMTWRNPIGTIPVWGTSAVGPTGTLFIAGVPNPGGGSPIRVARSTNAADPAVTPTFTTVTVNLGGQQRFNLPNTPNPGGLLGQVWVDVDRSNGPRRGWVYVVCSVSNTSTGDPLDVMFNRSTDGGQTWLATPIRINDDEGANWQWFGTLGVAPNGRIDVVWNDTRESGQVALSRLYYSHSEDGGNTWSANTAVGGQFNSLIGWPQQNKIGDYYDIASDLVGASVAYSATYNGEQDVYFVRLGDYDCNGNGVGDAADIAANPALDCNGNGIPDSCEIAAGTLADSNGDGIPDICECPADWNHSGTVNSQDFFDFLNSFFAGNADFNHNGVTNSQDYFDFLTAFFAGC